jgi:hypothetical protein
MPDKIYPLNIAPGIQRDGTVFSGRTWTEGNWVRFQRGLPRKIGGYKEIYSTNEITRGIYVVPNAPNFIVFYGTASRLEALPIDSDPTDPVVLGPAVNRTPGTFLANQNNDWQFDTMYSALTNQSILVAHAAPNLSSISSTLNRPIFYGDLTSNTPLVSNGVSVSGGIVVLHPFLFAFGNDGKVQWFEPNNPTVVRNDAFVSSDKIVAGIPSRGGTNSPAGLLWTLTSLVRVTYTGDPNTDFNFDSISSESSILSARSVIEYDNQYYWLGVDRFLVYNGTVQELPNDKNINFFFDNLNYSQRQKVWATKITRFGEIWWHYPSGNDVECNRAIIYNVRERTWYDTSYDELDFGGRSEGYFDQTFSKPIWGSTTIDGLGDYPLYVHEIGTDNVLSDGSHVPIFCQLKSSGLSNCATAIDNSRPETDINLYISRIEPDFIMTGSMQVQILAKQYAASQEEIIGTGTYDSTTEKLDFTAMGREIYLKFTCTGVNCDFQMGQLLIVGKLGDIRA